MPKKMPPVRTAFALLLAFPILGGCKGDSGPAADPLKTEVGSTAFDAPYDLSRIPWGSSIDEVRKQVPTLGKHSHEQTFFAGEDVMWAGVKLSALFIFDDQGFRAINLVPAVKEAEITEPAARTLKDALERVHGPPNLDESQANGLWASEWDLPSTKVFLSYTPSSKELRENAILAYSRAQ